uniref:Cytochrome P450 n=1 Tax=Arcella intermedia TaxID=1963864 RepID=A0A6B2L2C7_9EUKA
MVGGASLVLSHLIWKVLLKPFWWEWRYPLPGPRRTSWLMGNLPDILQEEPTEPHIRWSRTYPDAPIIRYFIAHTMRIVLTEAALAKKVLTDVETFTKNMPEYGLLSDITGYSLLTTADVDFHKKQRKICNQAFKYESVLNFMPLFSKASQNIISKWNNLITQSPNNEALIEVSKETGSLTLDIIGLGAFSYKFNSLLEDDPNNLAHKYLALFTTVRPSILSLLPGARHYPIPRIMLRKKLLKEIREEVSNIIQSRRNEPQNSGNDLLGILLNENISDSELLDLCLTFMVAGHETTSMALSWTMHALSKHPEVERKCREEIVRVLGEDGEVTKENISQLVYLGQTLNESLRLFAPVPVVARKVEKDVELGGYQIPKGCTVVVSPSVLHRNKKYWDNPEKFDPERWNNKSHGSWFIPFIDGPRNCIGKKFAIVEATVILANMIRKFSFSFSEDHPFRKTQNITLHAKPGLFIKVKQAQQQ